MPADMPAVLTYKWSGQVLDEGYIAFPKRLLRAAPKLFHGENALEQLTVALALVDYLRKDNRAPSVGFLAFTAGMDPERFWSRLIELRDAQLITFGGSRDAMKYGVEGLQQAILENSGED